MSQRARARRARGSGAGFPDPAPASESEASNNELSFLAWPDHAKRIEDGRFKAIFWSGGAGWQENGFGCPRWLANEIDKTLLAQHR